MNKNALSKERAFTANSLLPLIAKESEEARLLRTTPLDAAFTQALDGTLAEWTRAADEAAFKDL